MEPALENVTVSEQKEFPIILSPIHPSARKVFVADRRKPSIDLVHLWPDIDMALFERSKTSDQIDFCRVSGKLEK